ncbi:MULTISPECIES: hypothetical protein [unclassified Microbacterium]|uniref:hypothetical protein n=1 Tax=unclassified Microbacterium TaxID=2609290 RepID=UPI003017D6C5
MARRASDDTGRAFYVRAVYELASGDHTTIYGPYATRPAAKAQATRALAMGSRNGRRVHAFIQTLVVASERYVGTDE